MMHDQDVFLEMATNRTNGMFTRVLGEAALRADPINRAKIRATWPELYAEAQARLLARVQPQPVAFDMRQEACS